MADNAIVRRIDVWKKWGRQLKLEIYALYLACRHPQTPLLAKLVAALVVGYALSPIDLIPDFIPILGYLDDLLLLPLGIALVLRLIPTSVLNECRENARISGAQLPKSWLAGTVVLALWIGALALVAVWAWEQKP